MISLVDVSFCIFGLKKSGKSTLANTILEDCGESALYYDTLGESPPASKYSFYIPKDRYSSAELESVISRITPQSQEQVKTFDPPFRMFIIDEANRSCPTKPHPLPQKVADLNDQCRHYHMSVGYIARRPVQLNQDLTELADYLFIFRLTGTNDLKYLGEIVSGLDEAVMSLKDFEFVLVYPDKHFEICAPLTANKNWLEKSDHERKRIG